MRIWILQTGEPLPGIDTDVRPYRCGILAQALTERGAGVTWWSSTFDHRKKRFRREERQTIVAANGVEFQILHAPASYRRNVSMFRLANQRQIAAKFAEATCHESTPDLVLASLPTLELAHAAVEYASRRGIPIVVDVRDIWPDVYLTIVPRMLRPAMRKLLWREYAIARVICKRADALVAISEGYLDWALQLACRPRQESDRVFPLTSSFGAPESPPAAGRIASSGAGNKTFVFLGSFARSYDFMGLVRAAKQLQRRNRTDIELLVVGAGERDSTLRRHARGLANLRVLPWQSPTASVKILTAATAGLALYEEFATQSLPNKLFDYLALKLPIICSLPGEARQLILHEGVGLTYEAGCGQSLADTIEWLADNPKTQRDMSERAGRLFSERYTPNLISGAYAQFLIDMIATRSTGQSNVSDSST